MVAEVEATIAKRPEPFLVALQTLRSGLRTGSFGVEQRLAATEIAAELKLSATPVREALARLAGEGLVEDRRGQGYFVRRLTGADVADLYRLNLAVLMIAEEPRGLGFSEAREPAARQVSPVERVERLFEGWVLQAGGGLLGAAHGRLQARLAPVRRLEPLVIPDLSAEADALQALATADRAHRQAALRRFHRRRIRLADSLARLADAPPPGRRTIEPI